MQEMTTTSQNLPAMPPTGAWGNENSSREDLVIPRLSLQHDISQAVKDGKTRAGEFLNSVTGLAMDKPVEIIPILSFREFHVMDNTDERQPEYKYKELITRQNESAPTEWNDNGKPMLRLKVLNFLALLSNDIEGLPVLISFKKSGMYAGKVLSTHFQTSAMKGLPGARSTFALSSEKRISGRNQYWVPSVNPGRPTTAAELAKAYEWYQSWNANAVKVDDAATRGAEEAVPF